LIVKQIRPDKAILTDFSGKFALIQHQLCFIRQMEDLRKVFKVYDHILKQNKAQNAGNFKT
jgi:hypothetical protein